MSKNYKLICNKCIEEDVCNLPKNFVMIQFKVKFTARCVTSPVDAQSAKSPTTALTIGLLARLESMLAKLFSLPTADVEAVLNSKNFLFSTPW